MIQTTRSKERGTERSVTEKVPRFWEVDAARGVAILMMAVYHLLYDLDTFGGYEINSTSGFWARFADATAFAFLFLVGVSLEISFTRVRTRCSDRKLLGKYLMRGLRIFGYGMILTVASWALGMGVILFGILHLIGVSIILAYPFLRLRVLNLILGLLFISIGVYIQGEGFISGSAWLLPFGIVPAGVVMPDYRPLLPWFGVVLLGLFAGNAVYGSGRKALWSSGSPVLVRPLALLGRYSLLFYFVHQPLIVAALVALGIVNLGLL